MNSRIAPKKKPKHFSFFSNDKVLPAPAIIVSNTDTQLERSILNPVLPILEEKENKAEDKVECRCFIKCPW
jgi:hypothetical protein